MNAANNKLLSGAVALLATAFIYAPGAQADDMASFATGGYVRGLSTMAMMHKMDTDKDGTVSKDEWNAFGEKMFKALDKDNDGTISEKEFVGKDNSEITFATGAYARGLRTRAMFKMIDIDHDGTISHEEFMNWHQKVFDMMDTSKKGVIGPTDFIHKSG